MLKVGLTGGIACGKSFVGEALAEYGCLLIHADELGHAVLAPGGEAYAAVVEEFGSGVVTPQGAIDRKALAAVIASLGPLPPIADLTTTQILEPMRHDKKVVAGKLHFVLPTAIGATSIVDDVTTEEIVTALVAVGFRKE